MSDRDIAQQRPVLTTVEVDADIDLIADRELRPMLVRASAGTGKTYRLTARLLKVLLQGASPESILATTFTRKAAGEILGRVLLNLANAADENNDEALQDLRQQVGVDTLSRRVCLQLLETLLKQVHRLRICTLDSLFSQLARSFPFELDLPPAWRLTDEIEESWMRERAVDSVISTLDRGEMGAVLSMLGKGDVKRSVARELLQVVNTAYGIQRQCDADVWEQLKASKRPSDAELDRAAAAFRSAKPKQKRHQTKLAALAERLELRDFAPLADDTLVANIAEARRTRSEVLYYRAPFPEGVNDAFDVVYAAARHHVLALLQAQNGATGTVLRAYDSHVSSIKTAARALGFDDISVKLAGQIGSLDPTVVGTRLDGAIDHLLLDEFQDTSPAQWLVLRPIARRSADVSAPAAESPDDWRVERSFFCVGDTKQAIYGWRGGVAEIFDAVADQIDGVTEVQQNTSFRSSPVVIDAINRTFSNLSRHPMADAASVRNPADKAMYESSAVRRFASQFPRHTAFRKDLPGHVRLITSRRSKEKDADARKELCFEDAARVISGLHEQSDEISIGVLTRTNKAVAQMIFLLEQLGVPVSQEGGNPLTDSAAVEIVLSAMMMADHPGDGRWKFHVMNSPLGEVAAMGPVFVRQRVEDYGIAETVEFLAGQLAASCDARETLRLKQLTHLALSYERNAAPRLRDFVRLVRERRVERPQLAPVRVMTVHQSKGLEFDAVVLPELDAALTRQSGQCVPDLAELGDPPKGITRYLNQKSWHYLPAQWQRAFGNQADGAITEALCLLYVAMTRAKQSLHMVVQPCNKAPFDQKVASSLIYHALQCEADPTEGEVTLMESGDPDWMRPAGLGRDLASRSRHAADEPQPVRISFRPSSQQPPSRQQRPSRQEQGVPQGEETAGGQGGDGASRTADKSGASES